MNAPKQPPAVGKGANVRVDQQFHDDLATLMRTGMNLSDAIKDAVHALAFGYEYAWGSGKIPEGERFIITDYVVRRAPRPTE